jgi:hypothetical protein
MQHGWLRRRLGIVGIQLPEGALAGCWHIESAPLRSNRCRDGGELRQMLRAADKALRQRNLEFGGWKRFAYGGNLHCRPRATQNTAAKPRMSCEDGL